MRSAGARKASRMDSLATSFRCRQPRHLLQISANRGGYEDGLLGNRSNSPIRESVGGFTRDFAHRVGNAPARASIEAESLRDCQRVQVASAWLIRFASGL